MPDWLSLALTAWDLIRTILGAFPAAWDKFLFRRFWGPGIVSDDVFFVIDAYRDPRPRAGNRYIKDFPRRRPAQEIVGGGIIYGTFSPNAAALCAGYLLKYSEKLPRISVDIEVDSRMDATLICYGGSDSNLKTLDIEVTSQGKFYALVFDTHGQRAFQMGGSLSGNGLASARAHATTTILHSGVLRGRPSRVQRVCRPPICHARVSC